MSEQIQVTREAESKDGMTLGEMIQFVQQAQAVGVHPREKVLVRTGFKAQILRVTAGGKI